MPSSTRAKTANAAATTAVAGAFPQHLVPQTSLRTLVEPEDDGPSAQISRETAYKQPHAPDSAQQQPNGPSDDDDPSSEDDEDDGNDSDAEERDGSEDDDPPRASSARSTSSARRLKSRSPILGTDIPKDSKKRIKHAFRAIKRSRDYARVERLTGAPTYRQWRENISAALEQDSLMSILDGTIKEPPQDHDLRFEWESINIRAGRVLLSTVSKEINKDLAQYYLRPRFIWKQINSQHSVSDIQTTRDGFDALRRTVISRCSGVADYVHKIEQACEYAQTGRPRNTDWEINRCWHLLTNLDTPR
ncbi:uncharacterized protein N7498_006851 [Penicillium cinerascens]|uniref:Uncharacterized protein n=1 Tax=Penicillium cinerascens TaxID=70096 RepID=A0A9W9JJY9_9EURO|nr:uncharacterized protein N7498_006851 [Penicillium cinerascens]KAJ5197734.1 hypothetical protein N7498_006851 [Penicillium cinerascens]